MQQVKKMEELGEGDKLYSIVKSSSAGESIETQNTEIKLIALKSNQKLVFQGRRENLSTRRKTSRSRVQKQQT